jgi:hypothetical protein
VIAGSADVISFWGWAACSEGQEGDGGKAGERFKVTCSCQLPRSFWIRAKQYAPGPITCGICDQHFQRQNADHQDQGT